MDTVLKPETRRRESRVLVVNARTLQAVASSGQVQHLVNHLAECRPVETYVPSHRFRTVAGPRSLRAVEAGTAILRPLEVLLLARATGNGLNSVAKDTEAIVQEQTGHNVTRLKLNLVTDYWRDVATQGPI